MASLSLDNNRYRFQLELIVDHLACLDLESNPDIWFHDFVGDQEYSLCWIALFTVPDKIYTIFTSSEALMTQLSLTPKALWVHFGTEYDTIETACWYKAMKPPFFLKRFYPQISSLMS